MPEFVSFGKIARLNRDIVITEKIDGTNAAIGIKLHPPEVDGGTGFYEVWAQSRTRIIVPGDDNFGFAAWVKKHEDRLINTLGEGLHFGEWWGVGIQREYGLTERRFSLFNTKRWFQDVDGAAALTDAQLNGCAIYCVPVLYEGPWMGGPEDSFMPLDIMGGLRRDGSRAVPGYNKPEGIMVYHKAGNVMFKATCEKDEAHKSQEAP